MIVKQMGDKQVMLLSYWDGGYVKLDMTDPKNPVYLGDTDFTNPDPEAAESGFIVPPEGNGHQAEFTSDDQYVIGRRGLRAVRAAGEERRRRHRHLGQPGQRHDQARRGTDNYGPVGVRRPRV